MALDALALLNSALQPFLPSAITAIQKYGKEQLSRLRVEYTNVFSESIVSTYEKVSRIKTVIYRDYSVLLINHYVGLELKHAGQSIEDYTIFYKHEATTRRIISGTAGAGKSMLMRRIALDMLDRTDHGKIPIYVELRHFDVTKNSTLEGFICESVFSSKGKPSVELLKIGLQEGSFVLILDGFDEVSEASVPLLSHEINNISTSYPSLSVYVSTRPNAQFEATQSFDVFHVQPMSKTRIISLLENIDIMGEVKSKFVERVRDELYARHTEFLSSPLLATMMLIVFARFGEIPTSFNLFYEQAFETLYISHDLTKDGRFKRERFSGLGLDEFKEVFSAFCYSTAVLQKISFSYSDLVLHVGKSITYCSVTTDPERYILDLVQSVCVLQKDGLEYVFVHRSFQEYFAAKFVAQYRGDDLFEVIDAFSSILFGNTLLMLYGINAYLIDRHWTIPVIKQLISNLDRINTAFSVQKFLSVFYDTLSVQVGNVESVGRSWSGMKRGDILNTMSRLYPSIRLISHQFTTHNFFPFDLSSISAVRENPSLVSTGISITESGVLSARTYQINLDLQKGHYYWMNVPEATDLCNRLRESFRTLFEDVSASVDSHKKVSILF